MANWNVELFGEVCRNSCEARLSISDVVAPDSLGTTELLPV
jgi:hypothetical protein